MAAIETLHIHNLYWDKYDRAIKEYESQAMQERVIFPVSDYHRHRINEFL